ncbi:Suppressor of lurcher protein 1 [Lamellibrachia satsuma]|nr:Suppressor of lurcher protein 1 [Lamellibrachia satsuma]
MDSITVFVNIGGERSNIGVFCGRKRPHMLMSNDNRMEVSFISRTLKPHTAKGFKAEYRFVTDFGISAGRQDKEVVCGFNFKSAVTSNGTFTSPNFPGLYPRNTECHYLFYGTDKEKIHITFLYFDVEGIQPMCRENTQSDYVEFSNFNIKLKDRKMYRFCGTEEENQKKTVHSDGNFFRVTFKSNDIYDATGFEAFYQFMKQEEGPFPGNIARSSGITMNCPAMWMLCHVTISLAFAVLIS